MLEVLERDGRGRVAAWTPETGGATVTSPALVQPDVPQCPMPEWAECVVTATPRGSGGVVELVSGGTWFHPTDAQGPLAVPPVRPEPTDRVQVLHIGEELAVWHDAGGWATRAREAATALVEARRQATAGRLLWAPALGTPAEYAVWAYLGVDLFDASVLLRAAVRGVALTPDGPVPKEQAQALHGDGTPWGYEELARFNLEEARRELLRVRHAVAAGTLRALAERRCYAAPATVELMRRLDRQHTHLEEATPVHKDALVACMTQESLWMPEVERFRRRLDEAYRPPRGADVLVLLPCSATKPYRRSPSHRWFQRALDDSGQRHRVHEVMVTSPLGVVPRELEEVYPADRYDVPVTGEWSRDEQGVIRGRLAALLGHGAYRHVVAHVPASTFSFLQDLLPEGTLHTAATDRPQRREDCDRLRDALRRIGREDRAPGGKEVQRARKREDLRALASFQFGPGAADALAQGAEARGRWPFVKLLRDGTQLAMLTEGRGLLSLTLEGGAVVAPHGVKRVHMQDFPIRRTGSLFAVGVASADPDVRPGDDVVVVHGDEVRAVGQARMSAEEMVGLRRGVAVALRHVAPEAKQERTMPGVAA